jgi:uncharacterized protein
MISIRSLLLLVLVWILWRFAQRWYHQFLANQSHNHTSSPVKPPPTGIMVRCHHCHLHLPQEEAIQLGEAYFCCEAHQRAAQQKSYVGTH